MPSRYRHHANRLKSEIVARVAAGETLKSVCGDPAMPVHKTVANWARADAAFAEALAQALRGGAWRRVWMFDEAKAAALLARARAGEPIRALLGQPGMPSQRAYRYWKATQAPFAEAIHALRQRRDRQVGEIGRRRLRPFDPALADRLVVRLHYGAKLDEALAADPELPCRPTLRRWRREQPEFDRTLRTIFAAWRRRRAPARGWTPEFAARVVARIREGASFNSLSKEAGMPSRGALRRWMAARPEFSAAVAKACEDREDWYNEQILRIAGTVTPGTVRATRRRMGPLLRQLVRLRNRPAGAKRAARG